MSNVSSSAETRKCSICQQTKAITEFYTKSWYCKPCYSEYDRKKYNQIVYDPDIKRDKNLRANYGITLEEYNRLFAEQGGVCAICAQPETKIIRGKSMFLAVDHCHISNNVRALLCQDCNIAFGLLGEDPERIKALLAYAKKWNGV